MDFSLQQIYETLDSLGVVDGDKSPILLKVDEAIQFLKTALSEMDGLSVKGRAEVDALLGCMLAIESIIGREDANG